MYMATNWPTQSKRPMCVVQTVSVEALPSRFARHTAQPPATARLFEQRTLCKYRNDHTALLITYSWPHHGPAASGGDPLTNTRWS